MRLCLSGVVLFVGLVRGPAAIAEVNLPKGYEIIQILPPRWFDSGYANQRVRSGRVQSMD